MWRLTGQWLFELFHVMNVEIDRAMLSPHKQQQTCWLFVLSWVCSAPSHMQIHSCVFHNSNARLWDKLQRAASWRTLPFLFCLLTEQGLHGVFHERGRPIWTHWIHSCPCTCASTCLDAREIRELSASQWLGMRSTPGVVAPAEWSQCVMAHPAPQWDHPCCVKTKDLDIPPA